MRWRALVIVVAVVIAMPGAVHAHQASLTHADVVVEGEKVEYTLLVDPVDAEEVRGGLGPYVVERVDVYEGEDLCPAGPAVVDEVDDGGRFLRVRWTATCPRVIAQLAIEYTLFFDLDRAHQSVMRVHHGEEVADSVLREGANRFVWDLGEPPPSGVGAFVITGIEHILDGTDHIAFLLTLLLVIVLGWDGGWRRKRFRDALKATALIVTSFTVAHTVTLISASLGWVSVPGRVVESAIAASIAYTAVENVVKPDVKWRYVLTFAFGLVHGLGFARVLEVMLPPDDVVVPLLSFNVGVELGQLMIVAVALPVWWGLCGVVGPERYRRVVMPALSVGLAGFGVIWLIERVFDVVVLGI